MRFLTVGTTTNQFKTHKAWALASGLVQIAVSSMLRLNCTPSPQLYLRSTADTALRILRQEWITMQNMSSIASGFTPIERAVFRAICDLHSADRAALEAQLATATLLSRKNTGVGFFTDFSVDRASSAAVGGERLAHF
jgi:hypothetical protein